MQEPERDEYCSRERSTNDLEVRIWTQRVGIKVTSVAWNAGDWVREMGNTLPCLNLFAEFARTPSPAWPSLEPF
jgi:hypothetical protein